MRYTQDTSAPLYIRRLAQQVCDAVSTCGQPVVTESIVYYGLFRLGVSTDDAAQVIDYLVRTDRAQKSGVLLMFRRDIREHSGEESTSW